MSCEPSIPGGPKKSGIRKFTPKLVSVQMGGRDKALSASSGRRTCSVIAVLRNWLLPRSRMWWVLKDVDRQISGSRDQAFVRGAGSSPGLEHGHHSPKKSIHRGYM